MNPAMVTASMAGMGASAGMGGNMNQILELFKMQYLMKFLDGGGKGVGSGSRSLVTMFVLMGWEQFTKYVPMLCVLLWSWVQVRLLGKMPETLRYSSHEKADISLPQPPATKSIRAFIQFERHPEKVSDAHIDAVLHHVCTLPDVKSLRYNGIEMMPNFKEAVMIENDIWFEIINTPIQSVQTVQGNGSKMESISYRLSTYDHDITWLHKFVEQAIVAFEQEKINNLGSESYYFDQIPFSNGPLFKNTCMFTKSKFQSNRTLKNVYLRQIDELQERVEFFIRRRDWYDMKGIPHTLGIVMYGHPGCGKTSTIKAIANETKRHIFNISLSEIKTKEALKNLFYNDEIQTIHNGKTDLLNIPVKNRIYVIEDIDAMNSVVIKRSKQQKEEEDKRKIRIEAEMELLKQQQGELTANMMIRGKQDSDQDKLDLATLLNVLDGVRETPGRIIILSTNYPERLDEALLRPGRFDMMLEFEKHSCEVLQQHIEKHYDITLTESQKKRIYTKSVDKKWTPAEVSQILFRRNENPDAAIEDLVNQSPTELFKFSQLSSVKPGVSASEILEKEELGGTDLADLVSEAPTETQSETQSITSHSSQVQESFESVNSVLSTPPTPLQTVEIINPHTIENQLIIQEPTRQTTDDPIYEHGTNTHILDTRIINVEENKKFELYTITGDLSDSIQTFSKDSINLFSKEMIAKIDRLQKEDYDSNVKIMLQSPMFHSSLDQTPFQGYKGLSQLDDAFNGECLNVDCAANGIKL